MPETHRTRVLIIGAGPAGYTAAIYAARASLEPMLVAGLQPGGQLMITTDVENYPGFAEAIQGPWLMEQMAAQAEHVGTRIVARPDHRASISARAPFRCTGDSGDVYRRRQRHHRHRRAGALAGAATSEQRLQGAGVSACATCDGFFFRGKRVAVVGGGNTAVEEALYLTHHAEHVTLIHRRDALRAEKILQERLFAHPKISVIWDSVVEEITGGGTPAGGRRRAAAQPADRRGEPARRSTACSSPSATRRTRRCSRARSRSNSEGYILTAPGTTRTSVAGVFAAGDVQDKICRQAVTAAGTGCMAALEAEKYLAEHSAESALAAD